MSQVKDQAARFYYYVTEYKGIVPRDLEKELGWPNTVIYTYLTGSRQLSIKRILDLKERFPQLNLNWLIVGEGSPDVATDEQTVPLSELKKAVEQRDEANEKQRSQKQEIDDLREGLKNLTERFSRLDEKK